MSQKILLIRYRGLIYIIYGLGLDLSQNRIDIYLVL